MVQSLSFAGVCALFVMFWKLADSTGTKDANAHLRRLVEFVKFFLPAVTRVLFQALLCVEYHDGYGGNVRMLLVDRSVDCRGSDYDRIRSFAIVMIVALPVSLMLCAQVGLWRLRGSLLEVHTTAAESRLVSIQRAHTDGKMRRVSGITIALESHSVLSDSPFSPLFGDYKPTVAWCFDVADMARRLALTCLTVMLTDQPTFFLVSLSAAIFAVVVHTEVRPLRDEGLNAFVTLEHWLVLIVLLVLLLRDTSMFNGGDYWMADVVMLGISVGLVGMIAKDAFKGCFGESWALLLSGKKALIAKAESVRLASARSSARSSARVAPRPAVVDADEDEAGRLAREEEHAELDDLPDLEPCDDGLPPLPGGVRMDQGGEEANGDEHYAPSHRPLVEEGRVEGENEDHAGGFRGAMPAELYQTTHRAEQTEAHVHQTRD